MISIKYKLKPAFELDAIFNAAILKERRKKNKKKRTDLIYQIT